MEDPDDNDTDAMDILTQIQAIFSKYFRNSPNNKISFEMTLDSTNPMDIPDIQLNGTQMTPEDLNHLFHLFTHFNSLFSSHLPKSGRITDSTTPLQITLENKEEKPMRDYIVDVFDDKGMISVVAELPGVSKKDITLNTLSSKEIEIIAPHYERTVTLPAEIDTEHVKARYNNGILEIVLQKRTPTDNKHNIAIE